MKQEEKRFQSFPYSHKKSAIYGTTQSRSIAYDSEGFIKQGTDGNITSVMNDTGAGYTANAYNLVTSCKTTVDGKALTDRYEYGAGQRLKGITYPDSAKISFGYNGIGLLKEIGTETDATAYAREGTYNKAGHPKQLTAGNGKTRNETWDIGRNILTKYDWGLSGKATNTLEWNNRGNVSSRNVNGVISWYKYDGKNQVTEEKKGDNKPNCWTYDDLGNRKKETKSGSNLITIACYPKSDLIRSDGNWNYNYDANGNMIGKGKKASAKTGGGIFEGWIFNATEGEVWSYEYDLCNRLVKAKHSTAGTNALTQVAEYKYDFRNLMVCRKVGSASEYFSYDSDGKLLYTERGTEKHNYIYANGKLWCEIVTNGSTKNTYYHHTDHLGTTVCITNSSGTVVWECEKDAFGHIVTKTNSSFAPNFTGKFLDENTGLYYFNARWYDPSSGRFITEDPAKDDRNWLVYCGNNPLKYIDPYGLFYYTKDGQQHSNSDYSEAAGNVSKVPSIQNLNRYTPFDSFFTRINTFDLINKNKNLNKNSGEKDISKIHGHLLRVSDSYTTVNNKNKQNRGKDLLIIEDGYGDSVMIPVSSIANMEGTKLSDSLDEKDFILKYDPNSYSKFAPEVFTIISGTLFPMIPFQSGEEISKEGITSSNSIPWRGHNTKNWGSEGCITGQTGNAAGDWRTVIKKLNEWGINDSFNIPISFYLGEY